MTRILFGLLCFCAQLFGQTSLKYDVVGISVTETDSAYQLEGEYPMINGLTDTSAEARCNSAIYSLVNGWVENFKSDARQAYEELKSDSNAMASSYLNVGYSVNLQTARIISLEIGWDGMAADNAHPASESSTLVFDLSTGQELGLGDLFDQHSHYLDTLSKFCIRDLLKQGAPYDQVKDGAAPTLDNLKNFSLDKESLSIIFNVYQVDSYGDAPGGYTVEIPYSSLKGILRMNGPLDAFLK